MRIPAAHHNAFLLHFQHKLCAAAGTVPKSCKRAMQRPSSDYSLGMQADRLINWPPTPREVEVVIEVPRGSFLKRGSTGHIDFVSPLPCPFNYGAVPTHLGMEGDLLDALVLGPRLALGTRRCINAWGAVTLTDRGMSDEKLVCSNHAPSLDEIRGVLRFFRFYARCKWLLNLYRRRPGRNGCDGWCTVGEAFARARPQPRTWTGPGVPF